MHERKRWKAVSVGKNEIVWKDYMERIMNEENY